MTYSRRSLYFQYEEMKAAIRATALYPVFPNSRLANRATLGDCIVGTIVVLMFGAALFLLSV